MSAETSVKSASVESVKEIQLDFDEISQRAVSMLIYPRHMRHITCSIQGFVSNTFQGITFTYRVITKDVTHEFCVKVAVKSLMDTNRGVHMNHEVVKLPKGLSFEREVAITKQLKGCRG